MQVNSLPVEPQGKPKNTGVGDVKIRKLKPSSNGDSYSAEFRLHSMGNGEASKAFRLCFKKIKGFQIVF